MTTPSGGTATDAARFKPGDKARVTIDGVIDARGYLEPDYSEYLWGPENVKLTPSGARDVYGARVERLDEAITDTPAPYTEPRKGDKVELRIVGTLVGQSPCDEVDHSVDADCLELWEFREDGTDVIRRVNPAAFGEGRVRLVRAAAPTYEPGVYWSPSLDRNLLYAPDLSKSPWVDMFDGSRVSATDVPADLVRCDLVPREATT